MKDAKEALFICSLGFQEGMGHLYRSMALADVFQKKGWKIHFVLPPYPPARALLGRRSHEFAHLEKKGVLEKVLQRHPSRLVVVDLIRPTTGFLSRLKKQGCFVLRLDGKNPNELQSDLIVSVLDQGDTRIEKGRQRRVSGLDYWIFPAQAVDHAKASRFKTQKEFKRILVSFGQSDPTQVSWKVLEALLKARPEESIQVDLVIGRGFRNKAKLRRLCRAAPNVKAWENLSSLQSRFRKADLLICGGGGSYFEAALHGLPSLVYPVGKMNEYLAKRVEKRKLGFHLKKCNDLPRLMNQISFSARRQVTQNLRLEFTGQGAKRILSLVEKEMKKRNLE